MKHFYLLVCTAIVVIFSLAAALLYMAATDTPTDPHPLDKACYSLTDQNGHVYKSWFPPQQTADNVNIVTFNNDHTWGYVFGPIAMVADRDCLRDRYPGDTIVPPLEGEDK